MSPVVRAQFFQVVRGGNQTYNKERWFELLLTCLILFLLLRYSKVILVGSKVRLKKRKVIPIACKARFERSCARSKVRLKKV